MGANLHRKDNYADFAFLEEESHSVAYNNYIYVYMLGLSQIKTGMRNFDSWI